jgi:uncharacterized protein (UPF0332 family)
MKLKQKSEFNADAAELLIRNNNYAPSVHCSYYSVFQLMKVAMREFVGVNYETIDANVASSKSSEHQYIRKEILNVIRESDYSEYTRINRSIKELYLIRIASDYKNEEINLDKATKANNFSKEVISYIKKKFHV